MIAAQINEKIQAKTEAKATPPIPINFKNIIERNKLRKTSIHEGITVFFVSPIAFINEERELAKEITYTYSPSEKNNKYPP